MSPASGPPSDWVSGERVFAPPTGTFDVDWLVGAVLEAVPGTSPAEAREALLAAWRGTTEPAEPLTGAAGSTATANPAPADALTRAARQVADEARRSFRA